jgi:hypothetical protein
MTREEQNLIENLFDRLRQADVNPKDPEAEQLIRANTAALASAPYLLTQAVIVQEHALTNAQARIAELDHRLAAATKSDQPSGGDSFLSGVSKLFGGSKPTPPPAPQPAPQYQQTPATVYQQVPETGVVPAPTPATPPQNIPYPSTVNLSPSAGGGFLKSALATAAGVAGGAALFQGIESLIGHNAGAFGPALGERGFYPEGGNTEIIENNYYNAPPGDETERAGYHSDVAQSDFDQNQNIDFDPNIADNDMTQEADFDSSDDFESDSDDSFV